MEIHSHKFVETYDGFVAQGFDRQTDENTVIYYLQKFSDDELMKKLVKRLSNEEIEEIFLLVNKLLKTHFSDVEYHTLFLKDEH